MDVFTLRDNLIGQYEQYVRGFVTVKEPRARAKVEDYFHQGRLWPEPLVQLNPSFQPGRSIDELVGRGLLHAECAAIFRRRDRELSAGAPLRLHQHQDDAIEAARTGQSYVLTTGTGSGKSLAYFVPIVDFVLRHSGRRGVKAIVVYPMNALCNSQMEALKRFLQWGYPGGQGPVSFARYTGQETTPQRQAIIANPPDILLTNFMMLELILTRSDEQRLVEQCQGLEFLVLDELHTYRGRQGADVAMLARRVRERCGAATMRCVGTSATLAGSGTREQRQAEVAEVAGRIFGLDVPRGNVIGETLRRATHGDPPSAAQLRTVLQRSPTYPGEHATLAVHPLAVWAEHAFGLQEDEQGRLERRKPRTLSDAAGALATATETPEERCKEHLRALLLAGYHATDRETGFPLFAFRLHQFISRGDTLYATAEAPNTRQLFTERQLFVPGDRSKRLFPTAFCRVCGQDYLVATLERGEQLAPRELEESAAGDEAEAGFLVLDGADVEDPIAQPELLPEDWTEVRRGEPAIRSHARKLVPRRIFVAPDGEVLSGESLGGGNAWFMRAPFRFCLSCGVVYASGREKDFSRLAELSSEGRSTATTVLSMAVVQALRADLSLPERARKLLSFTDNRQDASLQAGHFNDFIQVTLLRSAILAAVQAAGPEGLGHNQIAQRVTEALALEMDEYASNPEARFAVKRQTDAALRDVTGYRLYLDLRRGWRVVSPNLEQVGLLRIRYDALDELCADEPTWQSRHPVLAAASPADRERVCQATLDYMRRGLAIKVPYLDPARQEEMKKDSYQYLRSPWAFDENERLREGALVVLDRSVARGRDDAVLGRRSLAGRYLARAGTWPSSLAPGQRLDEEEFSRLAKDLLEALVIGGQVEAAPGVDGAYQLQAAVMRWAPGDGTIHHDPIRVPTQPTGEVAVNDYFAQLYQTAAESLHQLRAREHTAQVPSDERQKREEAFGKAELPVLYCSPTMELGVDISDLNAVNMRNVPPTPANYAQRSGRAGRNGQPALVLTYCTSSSPHDQYYFRRPTQMVAGEVSPPRLDLANEELLTAHVHAVWLAETGQSLHATVSELLDLGEEALPLKPEVRAYIERPTYLLTAEQRCRRLLDGMRAELTSLRAPWFSPDWLSRTVAHAPRALDAAADRWRYLYRSARQQQERQHAIITDPLRSQEEREAARRLRDEAESQIELLTRTRRDEFSDFYSYRYFATEGFLPGYNFPRLPVTAYIPGRLRRSGEDEFLSRARFIALSEFGPRAIVYHEGSRYRVSRVVFRRGDGSGDGDGTSAALVCGNCGYGHFGGRFDVDFCDRCHTPITAATSRRFLNLLRLESVSTYRVDRISCDEEERLRLGYEMQTVFRFDEREEGSPVIEARFTSPPPPLPGAGRGNADGNNVWRTGPLSSEVVNNEGTVARVAYGPATTIWRINLGWTRRKDQSSFGFMLDMERGIWARSDEEAEVGEDESDPLAPASPKKRVVPFVDDHRNALLLTLEEQLPPNVLLSLQYALKRGIETRYQLEASELAAEPLPTADEPRQLLFYEAAEGGAGVLTRLATEPDALAEVAREALRVCHFDPVSGADLHRAERAAEDCEAACYDCLLSYNNQRYHAKLDRQLLPELLLTLSQVTGEVGAGGQSRSAQLDTLLRLCQSQLERDFITWLDQHGHKLPDRAQASVDGIMARPDFAYDVGLLVYVDGAPHRFTERQARDHAATSALENAGWTVLRVQGPESWPAAVAQLPDIFGPGRAARGGSDG